MFTGQIQIYYPEWVSRAKAAYFLGKVTNKKLILEKQKWEDVIEGLMHVLDYGEYSLSASKVALNAYCGLTGYKAKDVFDFLGAFNDWQDHKVNILKNLKSSR